MACSGGHGYRWNGGGWTPFANDDVTMTILEYKALTPVLEVQPPSIERDVAVGSTVDGNDTFTVRNVGFDTMNYAITDDAPWLSVSPNVGDSSGETDTISVSYSTFTVPSLAIGTYTATITVTAAEAGNSPQEVAVILIVRSVRPDFDEDEDVDIDDYAHLQTCFTGAGVEQVRPECQNARLDEDEDVDADDFTTFLDCMSGPNVPADPDCES